MNKKDCTVHNKPLSFYHHSEKKLFCEQCIIDRKIEKNDVKTLEEANILFKESLIKEKDHMENLKKEIQNIQIPPEVINSEDFKNLIEKQRSDIDTLINDYFAKLNDTFKATYSLYFCLKKFIFFVGFLQLKQKLNLSKNYQRQ